MRFVRDPATGKRVSRVNPEAAWVRADVPDLRIVDDALWQRVETRLGAIRQNSGANDPDRPKFWEVRRSGHVLTQKVFCGTCGGAMTNAGRDYLACATARKQGACTNGRGIRLETLILDALRDSLMAPLIGSPRSWTRLFPNGIGPRPRLRRVVTSLSATWRRSNASSKA